MPAASLPKLSAIDLNLLVALDALLREENVTTAGRSIGLSQPAASHALAKLRDLLDDPILVRDGPRMKRTQLARAITPSVGRLIGDIEAALLTHRSFEPKHSRRTFRIAANDYCGAVLLPGLIERVRREAPHVTLDVHPQHGALPEGELATGELDLALGTHPRLPSGLQGEDLFEEGFVVMMRAAGSARLRPLTLERFVEREHLLVASPGYGPGVVDHALERLGLTRRVAARVPHFLVAPPIIACTDLVLTLPERIARSVVDPRLRVIAPPLELERFPVQVFWHERRAHDPGRSWLRRAISAEASRL